MDTEILKRPELVKVFNVVVDRLGALLLVVALSYLVGFVMVRMLRAASGASERYRLFFQGFIPYVKAVIIVLAVAAILLDVLELPFDQLVYILGLAALAVGISSKETLGSVVAYGSIVWNKPFQIGDRIRVGDVYGQVIDIGISYTRLRTPQDSVATIPNSLIGAAMTVNTNYGSLQSMAEMDFFLSPGADPNEVKRILWEAAATSKYFYLEEPIRVLVTQFPFYTRYRVRAYTYDTRTEFRFMSDVTETALREFSRRGIPFCQAGERLWAAGLASSGLPSPGAEFRGGDGGCRRC